MESSALSSAPDQAANENGMPNLRPRLKAKMDPIIERFLSDEQKVFDLVDAFGSPLNVMFPQIIDKNVKAFKDVYKRHQIQGQIYYTSKPNKSQAVIRQAAMHDINIDVSSEEALKRAIGCGFAPHRIELTGPKNLDYLSLGIQLDCTINADNFTELKQIVTIHNTLNLKRKIRVFVRLGGFTSTRVSFTKQDNTFGVSPSRANEVFDFMLAHKDQLDFQGFSYYWSGSTQEQRIVALESTLELTFAAMKRGLKPKGLDIGGGFHVQYANDRAEWNDYVDSIKKSMLGQHISMTWNDSGLGFRNMNGKISGAANFMDHYMPHTAADDFYNTLAQPLPSFGRMTAAQIISDSLLNLYIEPGRSMLDQVGITIGRVNYNKPSTNGETLVALDMNRSNMHSTHQKLLTEPVILYADKQAREKDVNGVFYMGNLCVSYDIVQYNKTFPDLIPDTGDLACFINTGPYIMDFIESPTLHQAVADKIAIVEEEGRLKMYRDEKYKPVISAIKK